MRPNSGMRTVLGAMEYGSSSRAWTLLDAVLHSGKCVQIMVASTTAFLAAGRFGLAPTVNRATTAGLKFTDREGGVKSADPAGAHA
jgi:hypothetical protein